MFRTCPWLWCVQVICLQPAQPSFRSLLNELGIPRLPTGCPRLPELCQIPLERIEQPRPCRKYLTAVLACHEPSLSLNLSSLPRRLDPPISEFNFAQIFVANTFVLKGLVHCQRRTGRAGKSRSMKRRKGYGRGCPNKLSRFSPLLASAPLFSFGTTIQTPRNCATLACQLPQACTLSTYSCTHTIVQHSHHRG